MSARITMLHLSRVRERRRWRRRWRRLVGERRASAARRRPIPPCCILGVGLTRQVQQGGVGRTPLLPWQLQRAGLSSRRSEHTWFMNSGLVIPYEFRVLGFMSSGFRVKSLVTRDRPSLRSYLSPPFHTTRVAHNKRSHAM